MAKVTIREWYRRVNAAWPAEVPALTAEEHVRLARKLYRHATGRAWEGKVQISSGRIYPWIYPYRMVVNPDHPINDRRGLVHLFSHALFRLTHVVGRGPEAFRPHASAHARFELSLVKWIVRQGYLQPGALRPTPKAVKPAVDPLTIEEQRLEARRKRWATKAKRAATALKKIDRQLFRISKRKTLDSVVATANIRSA